jgi:hypothetical protein
LSWLDLLVKSTEENEAPERYFWWSGLATIAAIARKNIWLDKHYYKLYPNIYVALVSSRSGARKGVPISICKSILEDIGLCRVISGCNSIQGLTQELSQMRTYEGRPPIKEAQGIMVSDEFESFLTEDPKALTYLTALYNTHEHEKGWTKRLKSSPIEELKSPCLTLLVASNETLFDAMVKQKDVEGGFIARTFIVYEKGPRLINPLIYAPKNKLNTHELTLRLLKISTITGEFKWTKEAADLYEPWYNKISTANIDDRTGTLSRLGDSVLKAAMLISLARKDDLNLEAEDVSLAIRKCEECMSAINIMMLTSSNGDVSGPIKAVLKALANAPDQTISRAKLLSKLHPDGIDSIILDRAIESLQQSRGITQPYRKGKDIMYKMSKEAYAEFYDAFVKFAGGSN